MADAQGLTALRRLAEAAVERNRRIGERLIAEIERRRARIRKEFYEIGICLQQLAAPKIYAALGFASFGALATQACRAARTVRSSTASVKCSRSPNGATGARHDPT